MSRGGCAPTSTAANRRKRPAPSWPGPSGERARAGGAAGATGFPPAVFSLAGADWPEDYDRLRVHLETSFSFRFLARSRERLDRGGFAWAAPTGRASPSSAAAPATRWGARRRDGVLLPPRLSGPTRWGAVSLSQSALNAVYRDHLGLGPPTSPHRSGPGDLRRGRPDQAASPLHPPRRIGTAGAGAHEPGPAGRSRRRGDGVATAIVAGAGRSLGGQGRVSAQQIGLGLDDTPVVMGGGLSATRR